jgi:hypothetical protein
VRRFEPVEVIPHMKKYVTLAAIVLGVTGSVLILRENYPFSFEYDEKQLQRRVNESLPIGATIEDVDNWLQKQGADVFVSKNDEGNVDFIEGRKPYKTWIGTMGTESIEFAFDRNGKLTATQIIIEE